MDHLLQRLASGFRARLPAWLGGQVGPASGA
jgi:hypothetical protein